MLGATVVIVARDAGRGGAAGAEITGRVPLAQVEVMTAVSSLAQGAGWPGMSWAAAAGSMSWSTTPG
jgi:hypothetical protein